MSLILWCRLLIFYCHQRLLSSFVILVHSLCVVFLSFFSCLSTICHVIIINNFKCFRHECVINITNAMPIIVNVRSHNEHHFPFSIGVTDCVRIIHLIVIWISYFCWAFHFVVNIHFFCHRHSFKMNKYKYIHICINKLIYSQA